MDDPTRRRTPGFRYGWSRFLFCSSSEVSFHSWLSVAKQREAYNQAFAQSQTTSRRAVAAAVLCATLYCVVHLVASRAQLARAESVFAEDPKTDRTSTIPVHHRKVTFFRPCFLRPLHRMREFRKH